MKKAIIPLLILPLFLVGCGKNKDVYASSKNTIYSFELNGDDVTITGLNNNYKNQTDIIIPYSIDKHVVKRIENHSFEDVYRIKKVDMSKSKLEEIGASAFKKCTSLTDIIYPKTITSIEENAFEECSSLVKMDLSNCSLTDISNNLFSKCESLTGVVFPSTTKKIGSNIFSGCTNITELDFSYLEIEEIGDYAFSNLANLKDVKLSNTTKKIGNYAFSENKKIQKIDLTNTVIEEMGEGAFSNCRLLVNAFLPQTLTTLGKKSFYYCSKLSKVDLSKTKVEDIPESCFELCRYFVEDPDSHKKDGLKITLPSTLKTISKKAFYNTSIMNISIPKDVSSIADDAFVLCNKLEEIKVDSSNTNYVVHNEALHTFNKEKLLVYPAASSQTNFVVSPNTKVINPYAFSDAVNLTDVDLNSIYIEEIASYTFMNCSNLKTITIGADAATGIKKIGVKAFFGCKSLTSFNGEYSITEIGESAFYDCIALENVYLGESTSLTKIDAEAFYNCNKMKNLTLPGSLDIVGRAAFFNCSSLEYISFGANETLLNKLLTKCPDCGLVELRSKIVCGG